MIQITDPQTTGLTGGTYIAWDSINVGGNTQGGTGVKILKNSEGKDLNPALVFRLIKNKFNTIGDLKYKSRMKKIKALADKYLKLGHNALAEKFQKELLEEIVFAELKGAGISLYIEKSFINKYKYKVKGGHISDTKFKDYTKEIPEDILKRKKQLDKMKMFTDYVIYHYWDEKAEAKKEKKEKITPEEKARMKDPILFGIRKEMPDRLFFIGDWIDEHCDLTFADLIDVLNVEDAEIPAVGSLLSKLFKK